MKLIAVAGLCVLLILSSMGAVAQAPIPFAALEQSAGAQSAPTTTAADASKVAPAQSAHARPMTGGGKVMTGVGILFLGLGAAFIGVGASVGSKDSIGSEFRSIGLGAGAGFAGAGTTLIIIGVHRRRAN